MTALPQTTRRRLKKVPQIPSVWEGDRRPLGGMASSLEPEMEGDGECIIWVDGSEGCVRSMEIVPPDTGLEAVVRTLLRAIESPHHPAQPARPQKIIVRDREIQFFLRGALQNLDITIEYAPDLPLIDQLFQSLEEISTTKPPSLPPHYENLLQETAEQVWEEAPWELLADCDILALDIENREIGTVYICAIGMMGAEFGILLYRSLDSLKRFRAAALQEKSAAQLEQAFLNQDCWFLNFEVDRQEVEEEEEWQDSETTDIIPCFGSLHPYEGMRPFLDEEEAKIVYIALETLLRFVRQYSQDLEPEQLPKISAHYTISLSSTANTSEIVSVQIATLPELTQELLALGDDSGLEVMPDGQEVDIAIEEDLIPDGSLVTLGNVSWKILEQLKKQRKTYYQSLNLSPRGANLPAIVIQTSRPKAMSIIETIQRAGGLKAVCFNPGNDPFTGETYDLGMLQTGDGKLHVFAEYPHDFPQHVQALKRWHRHCHQAKGYCGLIIAMGATGAARGNPQPQDMLALFEVKAVNGEELGMGMLQLLPNLDFE
ncbi:hypothetical protein IQ238_10575 [Pleurocapsales cyanobacterium LEGE 06147]|nr:hypothetical protein [Pleurocapsales cyanobacterium LEGE 06147]